MPVVFLGHGSPMNAIQDTAFRRSWHALGARLPRPRAIVCVSAHWETAGVAVTAAEHPATIHDFGGFPQALFDMRYPAPGSPALARRMAELIDLAPVRLDPDRGLDHGVWSVLCALYPQADVPVVQLSMDTRQPGAWHDALARQLAPLRDDGVLVLASGNIVHNLRLHRFDAATAPDWAQRFDAEVRRHIVNGPYPPLLDPLQLSADAARAVPTPEHYLPLLYALALRRDGERVELFNTEVTGAISMTSLVIGG